MLSFKISFNVTLDCLKHFINLFLNLHAKFSPIILQGMNANSETTELSK